MHIMQRFGLDEFCSNIQRHKITAAYIVPPVALLLAKHPVVDEYDLSSLKVMHSAASPLAGDLIEKVYERLKAPIRQSYGMSEASPAIATQVSLYSCL
jgi:acyl-coenzyme A synthetase/AMP-(fatty) acid ligase